MEAARPVRGSGPGSGREDGGQIWGILCSSADRSYRWIKGGGEGGARVHSQGIGPFPGSGSAAVILGLCIEALTAARGPWVKEARPTGVPRDGPFGEICQSPSRAGCHAAPPPPGKGNSSGSFCSHEQWLD